MSPANAAHPIVRKTVVSIVMIVLLIGGGFKVFTELGALKKDPERVVRDPPPVVVRAIIAEQGPYVERLTGYGYARALERAEVVSEISGVIKWRSKHLLPGATVKKDEEMIRLDRRDADLTVALRTAEQKQATDRKVQLKIEIEGLAPRIKLAREELANLKGELARIQTLADEKMASKTERDRLRRQAQLQERQLLTLVTEEASGPTRLKVAAGEVAKADAMLGQAKLDATRTTIRAPFAGRIEARMAEIGARVPIGAPLFRLVDVSAIEVPIDLAASKHGDVRPGAKAKIRLREGGEVVYDGKVDRVSAGINGQDRMFQAFVVLSGTPDDPPPIAPGAFVVATVDGRRFENVFAIPRVAFLKDRIYVSEPEGDDGTGTAKELRPTVIQELPDVALVSHGLKPGDAVLVTNIERIADGSKVRVPPPSKDEDVDTSNDETDDRAEAP